jgi:hypothetical protein
MTEQEVKLEIVYVDTATQQVSTRPCVLQPGPRGFVMFLDNEEVATPSTRPNALHDVKRPDDYTSDDGPVAWDERKMFVTLVVNGPRREAHIIERAFDQAEPKSACGKFALYYAEMLKAMIAKDGLKKPIKMTIRMTHEQPLYVILKHEDGILRLAVNRPMDSNEVPVGKVPQNSVLFCAYLRYRAHRLGIKCSSAVDVVRIRERDTGTAQQHVSVTREADICVPTPPAAAAAPAAAAPVVKPKAKPKQPRLCTHCHQPSTQKCSGCMKTRYCSRDCSRAHWPVHKLECVRKTV